MATDGRTRFRYDVSMFNGGLPPAFDPALLPEARDGRTDSWRGVMEAVENFARRVFVYLDGARAKYAARRRRCWDYYFMEPTGRNDRNRLASIFARKGNDEDEDIELSLSRASVLHPVIYESVQNLKTRVVDRMFGRAPNYVEIVGREKNDFPAAKNYEALANYQQDMLIPTTDLADEWVLRSLVDGVGYLFRTWDPAHNCPFDVVLDPDDFWADPAGKQRHLDRWNIVRRRVTVAELLQGRAMGMFWFTNDDLVAAVGSGVGPRSDIPQYVGLGEGVGGPDALVASVDYQARLVDMDILMQREGVDRWIYRVQGLVVAVRPNPIPPNGANRLFRFPVVEMHPVVEPGCRYPRSITFLMLYVQDIVNSISHLMTSNLAKHCLGLTFAGPGAFRPGSDRELRVDEVNETSADDPSKVVHHVNFPDAGPAATNAIGWFQNRVADQTSGVTETVRGQQVSANQTAFSVGALLDQANARIEDIMRRARTAVRDYYMIGLMLNQLYLEPGTEVRITGKEQIWRGVNREDIAGVAGMDIVPTGYPQSAMNAQFAQTALNDIMMAAQFGDPTPLVREYLKIRYGSIVNVESILPEPGEPGHDPAQENEQMANGLRVTRDPNDDDHRHIQQHLGFAMLIMQQGWPQEIAQAVFAHISEHVAHQQMAMAQGGGAPGGGVPNPADNAGGVMGLPRGLGVPGLGLSLPAPDPKTRGEIDAQVRRPA